MRNLFIMLSLLSIPFYGLSKTPATELFTKANEAYAKASYDDAIKGYQQLLDSGYSSGALHYNLGNANYKAGNMASAILHYEKAHKVEPGNEDIQVNLQLANLKITDKIEAIPEFFLKKWWISFVMTLSGNTWAILGATLLLTGFALLVVYLLSVIELYKRVSFYTGAALILISLAVFGIANTQETYFNTHKEAIVFNGIVNVKSAPGEKHKTLVIIHEGTKVKVIEDHDNWLKVELPNGSVGWIVANTVQSI